MRAFNLLDRLLSADPLAFLDPAPAPLGGATGRRAGSPAAPADGLDPETLAPDLLAASAPPPRFFDGIATGPLLAGRSPA